MKSRKRKKKKKEHVFFHFQTYSFSNVWKRLNASMQLLTCINMYGHVFNVVCMLCMYVHVCNVVWMFMYVMLVCICYQNHKEAKRGTLATNGAMRLVEAPCDLHHPIFIPNKRTIQKPRGVYHQVDSNYLCHQEPCSLAMGA